MIETCAPTDKKPADPVLTAELLDGIADHLAHASDPAGRASIVTALVAEILDTAAWLIDNQGSCELASMNEVLAEARAHQARMSGPETYPALRGASFRGNSVITTERSAERTR